MLKFFRKFRRDEEGVTAIEYGLIAALVGVAIIGGATLLGESLNEMFGDVSSELSSATDGDTSTTGGDTTTTGGDTTTTGGDTTTGGTTTTGG